MKHLPNLKNIQQAWTKLKNVAVRTPLQPNLNLSNNLGANIYLKREDLQVVRSYKIRGAYNKINSLDKKLLQKGVVCASAGNHAQGVAYSCKNLKIKGTVFMPGPTSKQKINQVKMFGGEQVDIVLTGDTYDDAEKEALEFCNFHGSNFIHPFDDIKVIEGQATVGLEILQDAHEKIDYIFVPVGGGGLISGILTVFKGLSPETKIIGVEPKGAPSMKISLANDKNIPLETIDKFIDGAAVKKIGDIPFSICRELLTEVVTVPEGEVCTTILKLYNEDAIVLEPAGALSISALNHYKTAIKGKTVVSIVSGGNNDITRMEEIKERSLLFEGLKHYFIVRFPQRAGALKEFVVNVLGPNDDITHFEYSKKTSRELGPAVIGIELHKKEDFQPLLERMKEKKFVFEYLNQKPDLFQYLV
ncbi:MAG: threonine ammonia-lyase IlvA [Bacteroidota bacterium]